MPLWGGRLGCPAEPLTGFLHDLFLFLVRQAGVHLHPLSSLTRLNPTLSLPKEGSSVYLGRLTMQRWMGLVSADF